MKSRIVEQLANQISRSILTEEFEDQGTPLVPQGQSHRSDMHSGADGLQLSYFQQGPLSYDHDHEGYDPYGNMRSFYSRYGNIIDDGSIVNMNIDRMTPVGGGEWNYGTPDGYDWIGYAQDMARNHAAGGWQGHGNFINWFECAALGNCP
jgi:hypothetical protein